MLDFRSCLIYFDRKSMRVVSLRPRLQQISIRIKRWFTSTIIMLKAERIFSSAIRCAFHAYSNWLNMLFLMVTFSAYLTLRHMVTLTAGL